MEYLITQFKDINLAQLFISILSALIVGGVTFLLNRKIHFDQKWWEKKILKYEECVRVLSELEHIYNKRLVNIESSGLISSDSEYLPNHAELLSKLKSIMYEGEFYFDKKTVDALKILDKEIDNAKIRWGQDNPYDIFDEVCLQIKESKKITIDSASKILKLKK